MKKKMLRWTGTHERKTKVDVHIFSFWITYTAPHIFRRYMAAILPIRRKTPNQSINQLTEKKRKQPYIHKRQ